MVVDFPAPFGPRNPVTTPGSTTKLSWSTAVLSPYRLVSPSISIMLRPFHQSLPMQGTLRSAPPGAIYPRTTPSLPLRPSGIGTRADTARGEQPGRGAGRYRGDATGGRRNRRTV